MTQEEAQSLLNRANQSYARLREDPEAWEELMQERAEWDCTLLDGLEEEPAWPGADSQTVS